MCAVDKVWDSNHFTASSLRFTSAGLYIHGLAHCNECGRARADAGRADNSDNLRRRDVNRGAMWPGERDEKIQDRWENRRHILLPLARLYADDRWHQLLWGVLNRLQEEPLEVGRSALLLV